MQVETLVRFGEAESVHGCIKASAHAHKLNKRVDTYLLSVGLYLLHIGLRG